MQKPCHNHEEISQPHSPARCTPARDSASSSAGLPGGMASWALPWLLAASEPFGPDAMTPAEGMSQVNKMVSLSLSPSPSPKWYALHIYTFTSTRCNKRLVSHMCVSSEELLSASGVWANEDKLHTVRKYMCVCEMSPFAELWMIV